MPDGKVSWRESVVAAIMRVVRRNGSLVFSRQELISREMDTIIVETGTRGKTPEQTLSRILQELRNDNQIEFLERGKYRVIESDMH